MGIMDLSTISLQSNRRYFPGKSLAMTLHPMPHSTPGYIFNGHRRHTPGEQTTDETEAEDNSLRLPIEPDEGTALIPDDERVVNVPS